MEVLVSRIYKIIAITLFALVSSIEQIHDNSFNIIDQIRITQDHENRQIQCLANNIYFEARSEPLEGKKAVALVTMNRVHSKDLPNFPNTVCGVVYQKRGNSKCQFSWLCNKPKIDLNNAIENNAYLEAQQIAQHVFSKYPNINDITKGAQFYHASYSSKRNLGIRGKNLKRTVKIGHHIFYTYRTPL